MKNLTEKEKMFKGIWYDANNDDEILKERSIADILCFEFNQTNPLQKEKQEEIITKLFPNIGKNITILQPVYTDYGYNTFIGDNSFINHNVYFMDGGKITIGKFAFIGPNCGFYTATHAILPEERNQGLEKAKPITIGDNVWIGGHVSILPGISIGDNSIIGAGSVVTSDIPSNVIAVGNPCKVLREINESDKIIKSDVNL